jgi:hypothetical protein
MGSCLSRKLFPSILKIFANMCTRGITSIPSPVEYPGSQKSSSKDSSSVEMDEKIGPYGLYNTPILPPSAEMKAIVGDAMSMAGGVAAVLLQIAHPGVGAGVAANSSFTVRPVERGWLLLVHVLCSFSLLCHSQ